MTRDYVILANAWSARRDNPTSKHWMALEFARAGHRVLWLEGAGMRKPDLGSGADRSRIVRRVARALGGARSADPADLLPGTSESGGRIWIASPLLAPLPSVRLVRRFNGWLFGTVARFYAARLGLRDPAFINYVPVLSDALCSWGGVKVYHCVDRWDAFGLYDQTLMAETDRDCCECADVTIASARELYDRCRRYSQTVHLVPHGVDVANFSRALSVNERPDDLPPGPVIGFFGLLSEWIDQGLIAALSASYPDASIVLIGKADVGVEALGRCDNVHMLGPRPFAELPRYIAWFNVGIIPFHVNELTRSVNPVKLREMLAAGCPVVSTDLPEVRAYEDHEGGDEPPHVAVAGTRDDFVAAVGVHLPAMRSETVRRAIAARVENETWEAKASEIAAIINAADEEA